MKKVVASFILFLLSLSLFSALQFVGLVSANFIPAQVPTHSIEITDEGDVNGTDLIQRNDNIYTFTGDVKGTIVVFRNDIVIDGAGYTLQGNGDLSGVWLQEKYNVEIRNLHIKNFHSGITLTFGWSMDSHTNVTISGNTITDSDHGIRVSMFLHSNSVLGNVIENNTYGIYMTQSANNTFRDNQLINNVHSFWTNCELSVQMRHFINDIDASNTIDGKPIIYWVSERDKTVPSGAAYVALVNCSGITVKDQTLTDNSQGVLVIATNHSVITRNHIENNGYGITLFAPYEMCVGNTITENNITANTVDGINSWNSEDTIIIGNTITNNQENGINFFDSRDAFISENTLFGNTEENLKIWGNDSNNNTVADNNYEDTGDIPEFPSLALFLVMFVAIIGVISIYKHNLQKYGRQ